MKLIAISIVVAVVTVGGALTFSKNDSLAGDKIPINNVSVVDGQQIIEIKVKGGYQPRKSVAKAGIPTILRFNTDGTFDCSTVLRIPALDVSKNLPPSGVTDVDVGIPIAATLSGTCGMGMYSFVVDFQN